MLSVATAAPPGVYRSSASRPRLPTRMTLFTLPIAAHCTSSACQIRSRPNEVRRRLRLLEALFREGRGGAVGVVLDDRLVRFFRAIGLFEITQRLALEVVRVGNVRARGVIANDLVERFDGLLVFPVVHERAADVELRVGRLRGGREV